MEDNKTSKYNINLENETVDKSVGSIKKNEKIESIEEVITGQLDKNVVLFVGPREVGKTVALIRLTHYLKNNRTTKIEPNRTYRKDYEYIKSVNSFLDDLHKPDFNPNRTGSINFLVLDVFKNSELYCQFLEAPGEAYFNTSDPHDQSFPPYISSIMNDSSTNKIFVFFFEEGMLTDSDPRAYSTKIARLVNMMDRKKDDVIVLFNKCDVQRNLYKGNKPNNREFQRRLYKDNNYSDFFGALQDKGIPVKFLAFSSGDFTDIPGKTSQRWIHSENYYPETLWRTIDKCFKSWSIF